VWMKKHISKSLRTYRFRLGQLIDTEQRKPEGFDQAQWDILVANRSSDAAMERSAHMRSISMGKGSVTAQMKGIEREVVSRLVS
jgi:hypothetical protein